MKSTINHRNKTQLTYIILKQESFDYEYIKHLKNKHDTSFDTLNAILSEQTALGHITLKDNIYRVNYTPVKKEKKQASKPRNQNYLF